MKGHEVAVVRLTEPGKPDKPEAAVVSEWRGLSYVHTEGTWEREAPFNSGLLTCYPTPELVGIAVHLDMSNAAVKRLDQRATLNERVGLELWFPLTTDGDLASLDPLYPPGRLGHLHGEVGSNPVPLGARGSVRPRQLHQGNVRERHSGLQPE